MLKSHRVSTRRPLATKTSPRPPQQLNFDLDLGSIGIRPQASTMVLLEEKDDGDNKERRVRTSHPKVRTGCLTCK